MTWNWIRTNIFTPSRLVPLTAQLLTAGVAIVVTWLGTKGWLTLDPAQVVSFVTPLVLGIEASIFKWQTGWQKYEDAQRLNGNAVAEYDVHTDDLIPDVEDPNSEGVKEAEAERLAARRSRKR